jgi:acyl-CoA hydrolase
MIKSDIHKLKSKKIAIISDIMLPSQANANGNVHGGEIMKMMDSCAGCASMRYSAGTVVTARVDEIMFHYPVFVGQLVTCISEVIFVGSTSMETVVRVYAENMDKEDDDGILALTAMFTMVAIDKEGKPRKVHPMPVPEDEEELRLYRMGQQRYQYFKEQRKKQQSHGF